MGKKQHESVVLEKTDSPVFEETFHFLVNNPLTDSLIIKMMDKKSNGELGSLKQSLDTLFSRPKMTMEKQNLTLNVRDEARICLDMKIRVLYVFAKGEWDEEQEKEAEEISAEEKVAEEKITENMPLMSNKENPSEIDAHVATKEENVDRVSLDSLSASASSLKFDPDDSSEMKIKLTIRYR